MNTRSDEKFNDNVLSFYAAVVLGISVGIFTIKMANKFFQALRTSKEKSRVTQSMEEESNKLNAKLEKKIEETQVVATALNVANKEIEISNRIKDLKIARQNVGIADLNKKILVLNNLLIYGKINSLKKKRVPSSREKTNDSLLTIAAVEDQTSVLYSYKSDSSFSSPTVFFPPRAIASNRKRLRESERVYDAVQIELEENERILIEFNSMFVASEEIILTDRENQIKDRDLCRNTK